MRPQTGYLWFWPAQAGERDVRRQVRIIEPVRRSACRDPCFAADPARASAFGPPPNAPLSLEKLARIDEFLNDQVAQGEIPGAIVLIQRHGKPVYFKWFGKRDVDAGIDMTPDTIFPLHSLTKTVTSFAAMMLVDRGKIKLDDPVSKYIPLLRRHEGRRRAQG